MALTQFGLYMVAVMVFLVCLSLSIHFGVEYNKNKKKTTHLALSLTFGVISVALFGIGMYNMISEYNTRKMLEKSMTVHLH